MKNNLIYSRTFVYNINYHVVWVVKHRKKILTPQIEAKMQSIALNIAKEKGFCVHLFEVGKGVLWNHSYYVETIGSISEENIRRYIEKQTNSY